MGLESSKTQTKDLIKQDFYNAFKAAQVSGANKTPEQADQDLLNLCNNLATSVMDRVFAWLASNKKTVKSRTVGAHVSPSYVQSEVHNSDSTDQCGLTF